MASLHDGLLAAGFSQGAARLKDLVEALTAADFYSLEELDGAVNLFGLTEIPVADLLFAEGVAKEMGTDKVSTMHCY